jgi:hypothetical protein
MVAIYCFASSGSEILESRERTCGREASGSPPVFALGADGAGVLDVLALVVPKLGCGCVFALELSGTVLKTLTGEVDVCSCRVWNVGDRAGGVPWWIPVDPLMSVGAVLKLLLPLTGDPLSCVLVLRTDDCCRVVCTSPLRGPLEGAS